MTVPRRWLALLLAGALAVVLTGCGGDDDAAPSLEAASDDFYRALNEMLGGDVDPMVDVWSHRDDITYMSPFGELLVGWGPIEESWQQQADARLGGEVEPAELQFFTSDDLGVVVGFERGSVTIEGAETPVDIRATSVYRLEDGTWKMIGHHTDPLG